MRITFQIAFNEKTIARLLNVLAKENQYIIEDNPNLSLLYESGAVYQRELTGEIFCDYTNILARGHEDCDGLAAARAGELLARGYKALTPVDGGYELAKKRKLKTIYAMVVLRTRSKPDKPGLYHALVRYRVGKNWYYDDPSARLGMNSGGY